MGDGRALRRRGGQGGFLGLHGLAGGGLLHRRQNQEARMTELKIDRRLTREEVLAALKRAAPGANEQLRRLDEVFRLTPEQMTRRLR